MGSDTPGVRARRLRGRFCAQLAGTTLCMLAVATAAQAQVQAYVVDGDALAVIDTATHTVVDHVPLLGGTGDVAISPDGKTAYTVGSRQLTVVDLRARLIRAALPIWGEEPPDERIRLSPAGDRAYVFDVEYYEYPQIRVFDTRASEFLASIALPIPPASWHPYYLLDFVPSADGRRAYAVMRVFSESGDALWLCEIDTASGAIVNQVPAPPGFTGYGAGAAIVPERGVAYVSVADAILALDLASGHLVQRMPFEAYAALAWDSGHQRLVAWAFARTAEGESATFFAIDADSGRAQRLARFDWWPGDVALAPDGSALYLTVSAAMPRTVVVDAAGGGVTAIVPGDSGPTAVAFGPRLTDAVLPSATARPSPTPAALRSYQAFAASEGARTLADIDTGAPAVVHLRGDPAFANIRDLVLGAPDGRLLYALSYQALLVIDAASAQVVDRIEVPDAWNDLGSIAVAPDGATVWVAGQYSPTTWIIDPHARTVLGSVEMQGELSRQAFAPDGRTLYVGSGESTADDRDAGYLNVVDPSSRRVRGSIELPASASDVAVSPDGGLVYVVTGSVLTVVDTAAAHVAAIVPLPTQALGIALSADGGLAYVAGSAAGDAVRPTLSVIDTGALRSVATLPLAGSGAARRIVVTPDGQRALVAIDDAIGRVAVVDLSRLEVVSTLRVGVGPHSLAVAAGPWTPPPSPSPRARRSPAPLRPCMIAAHSTGGAPADGTLTLIDPAQHAVAGSIRVGQLSPDDSGGPIYDGVRSVAADPDGTLLYAIVQPYSGGAGYIAAIDTASRAVVDTLTVGLEPAGLAVTADGTRALVLNLGSYNGSGSTLTIVDLRAWRVLDEIVLPDTYAAPYLSADGRQIYLRRDPIVDGERADVLTAIDANTYATAFEIQLARGGSGSGGLAVLPDGRTLLTDASPDCGWTDVIRVVDLAERSVSGTIEVPVTSWSSRNCGRSTFAVSPDGREVYRTSGASPGTVAVVDVAARRVVDQIPVQESLGGSVFTPDGAFVYASSWMGVSVLDVAARQWIGRIETGSYSGALIAAMIDGPCEALPAPTGTPTHVATPDSPPTPSPTPTPALPVRWVELAVGSTAGKPGTTVPAEVRLATAGHDVAGVQIDVAFLPPVEIAARADGRPACRVNPDIGKPATAFVFKPIGCGFGECGVLRALVIALASVDPIADGSVLFTCDVAIAADAAPGSYRLRVASLGASDPDGNALPALGRDGTVTVAAPGHLLSGLHGAGGSCAISPPNAGSGVWWIIAPVAFMAVRRRRTDSMRRLSHRCGGSGELVD